MQTTRVLIEVARPQPMRRYMVQIKAGAAIRDQFDVYATSRTAAQRQHEGLCADGEQAIALTPEEWAQRVDAAMLADKRRDGYGQRHFAAGLAAEQRRADVERVCGGAS